MAILLPNCPQHLAAFYAVLKLGATVVEHNPLYTAHELEHPFNDHGARVAICWDKAAPTLEKLRGRTPLETIVSVNMTEAMPLLQKIALRLPIPSLRKARAQLTADAPNTIPWESLINPAIGGDGSDIESPTDVARDTTALILYTSGTTGAPKGAQLSHGNLVANVLQGKAWVPGLGEQEERLLAALPMFHAYGLTMVATLGVFIGGGNHPPARARPETHHAGDEAPHPHLATRRAHPLRKNCRRRRSNRREYQRYPQRLLRSLHSASSHR